MVRQIDKPLSVDQVRSALDGDKRLRVIIAVSLSDLIENDIEGLNDLCEERIVEEGILSDIGYKVVGQVDDLSSGLVLIQVSAEVDLSTFEVAEGDVLDEQQTMDRDDVAEIIGKRISNMDGEELLDFCKVNLGGKNHRYDESTESVVFDLE